MEEQKSELSIKDMLKELKELNKTYLIISSIILKRGITPKIAASKKWTKEKIGLVEEKIEPLKDTAKEAGYIALGVGVLGTKMVISGAKTLAGKFKEADDKRVAHQIEFKRNIRRKVRDARDYIGRKKDDIEIQFEEKREIATATMEASKEYAEERIGKIKDRVRDTVGEISDGLGEVRSEFNNKKESVKDTVKDATDRFNQRKNDTLLKVLEVGRTFSEGLLKKIESSIYTRQEQQSKYEQRQQETQDKQPDILE